MLFPTHVIVAYLVARRLGCSLPWTVLGAVLPDLIDKPLGRVGETDRYHSIAHSLLSVAIAAPWTRRGRALRSLWLGWATHVGADAAGMAANGRRPDIAFLLWPIARERPYAEMPDDLVLPGTASYFASRSFALELALWGLALVSATDRSERA